jgi:hypothetical protein
MVLFITEDWADQEPIGDRDPDESNTRDNTQGLDQEVPPMKATSSVYALHAFYLEHASCEPVQHQIMPILLDQPTRRLQQLCQDVLGFWSSRRKVPEDKAHSQAVACTGLSISLAAVMTSDYAHDLLCVLSDESLLAAQQLARQDMAFADICSLPGVRPLVRLGLVFVYRQKDKLTFVMPEEFRQQVKPEALSERSLRQQVIGTVIACIHLYGAVERAFAISQVKRYPDSQSLSDETIEACLDLWLRSNLCYWQHKSYLTNTRWCMRIRAQQASWNSGCALPYWEAPLDELLRYREQSYVADNPYLRQLQDHLSQRDPAGSVNYAEIGLRLRSERAGQVLPSLLGAFNDKLNADERFLAARLLQAAAMETRTIFYRGHSEAELTDQLIATGGI